MDRPLSAGAHKHYNLCSTAVLLQLVLLINKVIFHMPSYIILPKHIGCGLCSGYMQANLAKTCRFHSIMISGKGRGFDQL